MTSSPFAFNFDTYLLAAMSDFKMILKTFWGDYLEYQYGYVCKCIRLFTDVLVEYSKF